MQNDLISRKELAAAINGMPADQLDSDSMLYMFDVIRKQVAVDAVPVVYAYWIPCPGKSHIWHCSACGDKINYKQNRRTYNIPKVPVEQKNKFCRNCGAIMKVEEI